MGGILVRHGSMFGGAPSPIQSQFNPKWELTFSGKAYTVIRVGFGRAVVSTCGGYLLVFGAASSKSKASQPSEVYAAVRQGRCRLSHSPR